MAAALAARLCTFLRDGEAMQSCHGDEQEVPGLNRSPTRATTTVSIGLGHALM